MARSDRDWRRKINQGVLYGNEEERSQKKLDEFMEKENDNNKTN